jgi:hypothetical protein
MTPVTRANISLDDFTIALLDLLHEHLGASRSEIIRRGVGQYFLQVEPLLQELVDGKGKKAVRDLAEQARKGRKK